jgi:type III pantothenate kinase
MGLVIDLGNTNKKLAIFKNDKLLLTEQYPEITVPILRDFVKRNPGIGSCILSSVVPHRKEINRFLESNFWFLELDAATKLPFSNHYLTKKTLGNDRIAAVCGGLNQFPGKDLLVVNAGTCITYDILTAEKEYLGGAITPGLNMRLRALHTFTGKLPLVTLDKVPGPVGRNTRQSILSGVVHGAVSEVEGMISRYRQEFPDLRIVLSGGDYKYFDKRLKISIFALPNIVLHGLYQILLFNVTEAQ